MQIITDSIALETRGDAHMVDVTGEAKQVLERHGLKEGHMLLFVSGSTAGLSTVEFEPGLIDDIPAMFERIAPKGARYRHEDTWHDGNGHSHCRATLLGPSLTVPFSAGRLLLGTWQQIILVDFDNRPRHRDIVVQLTGAP